MSGDSDDWSPFCLDSHLPDFLKVKTPVKASNSKDKNDSDPVLCTEKKPEESVKKFLPSNNVNRSSVARQTPYTIPKRPINNPMIAMSYLNTQSFKPRPLAPKLPSFPKPKTQKKVSDWLSAPDKSRQTSSVHSGMYPSGSMMATSKKLQLSVSTYAPKSSISGITILDRGIQPLNDQRAEVEKRIVATSTNQSAISKPPVPPSTRPQPRVIIPPPRMKQQTQRSQIQPSSSTVEIPTTSSTPQTNQPQGILEKQMSVNLLTAQDQTKELFSSSPRLTQPQSNPINLKCIQQKNVKDVIRCEICKEEGAGKSNFGAREPTCTACKKFFRHWAVSSNAPGKAKNCIGNCNLEGKIQRNDCPQCRFSKLESLGMHIRNIQDKLSELCLVCNDISCGLRYGVQCCHSCSVCFGRSKNLEIPPCDEQNLCPINIKTRSKCLFCRLAKCKAVGMKFS